MIKISLTTLQMEKLQPLLHDMLDSKGERLLTDKLVHVIMTEVYKKIHGLTLFRRDKYQLTLNHAQAIAFVIFFQDVDLSEIPHEDAIVRKITLTINPKIA